MKNKKKPRPDGQPPRNPRVFSMGELWAIYGRTMGGIAKTTSEPVCLEQTKKQKQKIIARPQSVQTIRASDETSRKCIFFIVFQTSSSRSQRWKHYLLHNMDAKTGKPSCTLAI